VLRQEPGAASDADSPPAGQPGTIGTIRAVSVKRAHFAPGAWPGTSGPTRTVSAAEGKLDAGDLCDRPALYPVEAASQHRSAFSLAADPGPCAPSEGNAGKVERSAAILAAQCRLEVGATLEMRSIMFKAAKESASTSAPSAATWSCS